MNPTKANSFWKITEVSVDLIRDKECRLMFVNPHQTFWLFKSTIKWRGWWYCHRFTFLTAPRRPQTCFTPSCKFPPNLLQRVTKWWRSCSQDQTKTKSPSKRQELRLTALTSHELCDSFIMFYSVKTIILLVFHIHAYSEITMFSISGQRLPEPVIFNSPQCLSLFYSSKVLLLRVFTNVLFIFFLITKCCFLVQYPFWLKLYLLYTPSMILTTL